MGALNARATKRWLVAAVLALVAIPSSAQISLDTGESAIFNYDFTTLLSPPTGPLETGTFNFIFSDRNFGDSFTLEIFGDLNASPSPPDTGLGPFTCATNPTCFAAMLQIDWINASPNYADGLFSARVTVIAGPLTVTASSATAFDEPGVEYVVEPSIGEASVPEPATLALLGLGLAGLATTRRRKLH